MFYIGWRFQSRRYRPIADEAPLFNSPLRDRLDRLRELVVASPDDPDGAIRIRRAHQFSTTTRHKSGYALRFPRIARIRDDKNIAEISTIDEVRRIYEGQLAREHHAREK